MKRAPLFRGRIIAGARKRRAQKSGGDRAESSSILFDIVTRRRDDIAERGTDWVFSTAPDLQGKRPRPETKRLVERVIDVHVAIFQHQDRQPLHEFVEHVTSFRASLEFRISTLLRGLLSFKRGLSHVLQEEQLGPRQTMAAIEVVDEIYYEAIFQLSDVYGAKLVHTIKTRRDEIEVELAKKCGEVESTMAMVEGLRQELMALSLPILRICQGVLLVPLVGEISPERAELVRSELLTAVVAHRARAVLIDVTGLSLVDAHAAGVLGSILRAVSLLGAESMIVGIRGEVARLFVAMGEVFLGTPTFATLEEGLRRAIRIGQSGR